MKHKLSAKITERLPAPHPSGKQKLFWDTQLRGFGVLVSGVSNAKTFVVQRDLPGGKTRRITIAPTNVVDLAEARRRAELVLADMYMGRDPKVEASRAQRATLRAALEDYLTKNHLLRPASASD